MLLINWYTLHCMQSEGIIHTKADDVGVQTQTYLDSGQFKKYYGPGRLYLWKHNTNPSVFLKDNNLQWGWKHLEIVNGFSWRLVCAFPLSFQATATVDTSHCPLWMVLVIYVCCTSPSSLILPDRLVYACVHACVCEIAFGIGVMHYHQCRRATMQMPTHRLSSEILNLIISHCDLKRCRTKL